MSSEVNELPKDSRVDLSPQNHTAEILIVGLLLSVLLFIGTPLFTTVFPSTQGQSLRLIREVDIKQQP